MPTTAQYAIRQDFIPSPSKRRSGLLISAGVKFLVAHDTGNPGSSASANVRYYKNSRDQQSASAHLFVDDREIVECVPALTATPEKAWHVRYNVPADNSRFGVDANDCAIGVEYCYGGSIDADEAYRRYVWVLAEACAKFSLEPLRHIAGHFELDPGRKTDPVSGLAASQRSFDQLLRDVERQLLDAGGTIAQPPEAGVAKTRVRLKVREGAPSRLSPAPSTLEAHTEVKYTRIVRGEVVSGNDRWLEIRPGAFVWSGGVELAS